MILEALYGGSNRLLAMAFLFNIYNNSDDIGSKGLVCVMKEDLGSGLVGDLVL